MSDYIEQQEADVHGVLVVRNGYTVLGAYYPPYGPHIRHGTASIGKSFTGALVGIAIREGYIEAVDQKVADFFPDYSDLHDDPLKRAMTIEHLLTRTFTFAPTYLFEPLCISRMSWSSDPHGIAFGVGGLRLTSRDMVRFGQLYLQGGVWNGKQVVPAEWVEASAARQVSAHGAASYYGYQWWVRGNGICAAHGYRGKRIFVIPDLEMVVVVTAARQSRGGARLEARISEIE